jgi:DNA-binding transcriptional ArsR family regulator
MTDTLTSSISRPGIYPLRAKLFHGFADPSRLAILEALCASPQTVGELVTITGLSQPNTSNHLSCLLDCGLVIREQRGRFGVYSLADERVAALLALADEVLGDHAAQFAACTRYDIPEVKG